MRLIDGNEMMPMHPWYRGYDGLIEQETATRYKITGKVKQLDETTVEITELPLKTWTQSYKEQLETWVVGNEKVPAWIKDYKEYHTDAKVNFLISLTEENMKAALNEGLESKFKLTTTISTSNLVCHDLEGRIKKYNSVLDIMNDFYNLREKYYQKRKVYIA
jgi:DNA topoisomerase-2